MTLVDFEADIYRCTIKSEYFTMPTSPKQKNDNLNDIFEVQHLYGANTSLPVSMFGLTEASPQDLCRALQVQMDMKNPLTALNLVYPICQRHSVLNGDAKIQKHT